MSATSTPDTPGLEFCPAHRGKHLFRVRQTYVANMVGDLVRQRRPGAAKLDLRPSRTRSAPERRWRPRNRAPCSTVSYEKLHDLVRDPYTYSSRDPRHSTLTTPPWSTRSGRGCTSSFVVLEKMKLIERRVRPAVDPASWCS